MNLNLLFGCLLVQNKSIDNLFLINRKKLAAERDSGAVWTSVVLRPGKLLATSMLAAFTLFGLIIFNNEFSIIIPQSNLILTFDKPIHSYATRFTNMWPDSTVIKLRCHEEFNGDTFCECKPNQMDADNDPQTGCEKNYNEAICYYGSCADHGNIINDLFFNISLLVFNLILFSANWCCWVNLRIRSIPKITKEKFQAWMTEILVLTGENILNVIWPRLISVVSFNVSIYIVINLINQSFFH